MKILVLSDSHGCSELLQDIANAYAPVIDTVLFCGDGARDWDTVRSLPSMRDKRQIAVAGNCDMLSDLPRTSFDNIGAYRFYVTHGHLQYVKEGFDYLAADVETNDRQVAVFGHTHRQYCGRWGDIFLFNPGAVLNSCYGTIHIHDDTGGITFRHWYWDHGDAILRDEYHF